MDESSIVSIPLTVDAIVMVCGIPDNTELVVMEIVVHVVEGKKECYSQ